MSMLGLALFLGVAAGDPSWLAVRECSGLDAGELAERVTLEYGVPQSVQVDVRCDAASSEFTIALRYEDGRRLHHHTPRMEGAVERYLAIEIAELLATPPIAAPVVPAEPDPEFPPPPPVTPRPLPMLWVDATARAEIGGTPITGLGGLGLGVLIRPWRRLAIRAETLGMVGRRGVDAGNVVVGTAGAGLGLGWLLGSRTALSWLGAGARAQAVWLRGQSSGPAVGTTHVAATWSPWVGASVLGPNKSPLAVGWLQVGWMPRAIRGQFGEQTVFTWSGPWVALGVGIGGSRRR